MRSINFIYVSVLALLIAGCDNADFKRTKGGLPYKIIGKGKGEVAKAGNILKVQYVQKINDSVLASSYTAGKPAYVPVSDQTRPYDITEILPQVRKGDSVYVVQSVDTIMRRNPGQTPPFFKKGGKLITTFRVIEIFKNQEEAMADEAKDRENQFANDPQVQSQLKKDDATLSQYLKANNITATKTANGTYIQLLSSGTGPKVEKGNSVSINYTGRTLAGKVFDSNVDTTFKHAEPYTFVVGVGQSIRGFDEAILTLKKGDKARLFIPSMMAYGSQSPSPDIKAYENLIFDIEILEVSTAQAPPPPPPHGSPEDRH